MPLFADESGKKFTKPATGKYVATLIDVVDLGLCTPKNANPQFSNAPVRRVQLIWNVVGADGKQFEYSEAPPNKLGEGGGKYKPTRLYTISTGVLQGAIPQPFATFDVESLLGRSNELFIVKTGEGNDARSEIAGFLPVPPNYPVPGVPAGFIRKINRQTATPSNQAQPISPAQQAAVQNAPAEVKF